MESALPRSSLLSTQVCGRSLVQSRPRLTFANRLPSLIDLDQSYKLTRLRPCGIKVIRFFAQRFPITGGSASIACLSELRRILSRERQLLLAPPALAVLVMLNQLVSPRWLRLLDDNRAPVRFVARAISASLSPHSLAA